MNVTVFFDYSIAIHICECTDGVKKSKTKKAASNEFKGSRTGKSAADKAANEEKQRMKILRQFHRKLAQPAHSSLSAALEQNSFLLSYGVQCAQADPSYTFDDFLAYAHKKVSTTKKVGTAKSANPQPHRKRMGPLSRAKGGSVKFDGV